MSFVVAIRLRSKIRERLTSRMKLRKNESSDEEKQIMTSISNSFQFGGDSVSYWKQIFVTNFSA